jgi:hypothetical protein
MNDFATIQQPISAPIPSGGLPAPIHRLLVLTPWLEGDLTPMAGRVWQLAGAAGVNVLFLGMCREAAQEASLRRKLITLAAMLKDGGIRAEAEVVRASDWVEAVKPRLLEGDMLICMADQRTGLMQRPLGDLLRARLDAPLTILSGFSPALDAHPKWGTRLAAWGGLIAIVLLFSLLQAGILLALKEWTTGWMLLSIAAEYGSIAAWNNRF